METQRPASGRSAPFPLRIQPVVLAGGRSRRFGRDKLLEPIGGEPLVQRSVDALTAVLDAPVCLVGPCNPQVRTRAPLWLDDHYPGCGPLGGICSALEHFGCDVFVLAGDLPNITAAAVEEILAAAAGNDAEAVLAISPLLEPCIGLYRVRLGEVFRRSLDEGQLAIHRVLAGRNVLGVPLPADICANINRPEDVAQRRTGH